MDGRPVLYHFPPSPYSMRVRLALEEKGVAWESRLVDIAVRRENYAPWYVRMHPGAVVPLLVDGDHVISESERIVRFIDEHYDGPKLTPEDPEEHARMERWFERARDVPLERIHAAVSDPRMTRGEAAALAGRVRHLEALAREHPDLAELYRAKIRDMEAKHGVAAAPPPREEMIALVEEILDALEAELSDRDYLAGPRWSLAEAMWTPVLGRLSLLKLAHLWSPGARPAVARWWARVKARPSFAGADVWDRFKPWALAPLLLRPAVPYLVAVGAMVIVVVLVARMLGC
jgi:glutathione S-transferase